MANKKGDSRRRRHPLVGGQRPVPSQDPKKREKARYERARRRCWNVLKKIIAYHTFCEKRVFAVVQQGNTLTWYSSENIGTEWPPSADVLKVSIENRQ